MKPEKISIAKMQGKLNRNEMKNIMAGSGGSGSCSNSYCDVLPCCGANDYCDTGAGARPLCRRR